ncbi:MAG: hypothetical protein LCI00_19535 [Chloroflexi bacterium]|nr:hypothetical protein [Chloroflexota bacterium]MCC6891406.1 hypothetical protein [Anaerolineae bacterium]
MQLALGVLCEASLQNGDLPLTADCNLLTILQQTWQRQTQMARRRQSPSHPLQNGHFSATLPHHCRHKMTVQRHYGSIPPVISAGNMHKFRSLCIL